MIKRNKKDIHKYIVLVFKDIAKCITSSNYCSAGLCYNKYQENLVQEAL